MNTGSTSGARTVKKRSWQYRLEPIDYMAIIAAAINFLVVSYIIGYWLLH